VDAETERAVRSAIGQLALQSPTLSSEALIAFGWEDLLSGDDASAVRLLFEEKGRLLLGGPALDSVVLATLAGPWSWTDTRVAYPLPGRSHAGASSLEGVLTAVPDADVRQVLVPVDEDGQARLHVVPLNAAQVVPISALTPELGLARFTAPLSTAEPAPAGLAARWPEALVAGRRAAAHELVGLSRQMLQIAVSHVNMRHQFGRPLGANQAVQHRLADVQVELAAAEMVVDESWRSVTPLMGLAAKAQAGRAFESVATHGQQVLGAIGYTWEHEWHRHLRHGMVLAPLLGGPDECEREIGRLLSEYGVVRVGQM
jgi:hypothetical protein